MLMSYIYACLLQGNSLELRVFPVCQNVVLDPIRVSGKGVSGGSGI